MILPICELTLTAAVADTVAAGAFFQGTGTGDFLAAEGAGPPFDSFVADGHDKGVGVEGVATIREEIRDVGEASYCLGHATVCGDGVVEFRFVKIFISAETDKIPAPISMGLLRRMK